MLSGCGADGGATSSGPPVVTMAPSPAPTPSPSPTTNSVLRLIGMLPAGLAIADSQLASDEDIPHFHLNVPDNVRYNQQAEFERQFPRLAPWGECITMKRTQPASVVASCHIRRFDLVEEQVATGNRSIVATFDLSAARRSAPVACGFTATTPPIRDERTFCAGANYRRQDAAGRLCWYNWCSTAGQPDIDGISPMTGGRVSALGILEINVSTSPHQISHWWTQTGGATAHPSTRTAAGYRYLLEIEFYTLGDAVLRVGADRWVAEQGGHRFACNLWAGPDRENCQLYFSNWLRDTTGDRNFKLLRFHLDG